jgi:cell division protein FtsW
VQKIFYLPEAHTDFILAIVGEELGVAGVCGLIFLYGLFAYAGLRVAKKAKGAYASLLAAGITSLVLSQACLNLFAILGLAPLTGVPLPFISYGSTNLVVLLAGMGLLLNIARGGTVHLREIRTSEWRDQAPSRADGRDLPHRRRRDGRARRAGARGRGRAAG